MGSRSPTNLIWLILGLAAFFLLHNRHIGGQAPDFALQGVYGGDDYHLDSFHGKSVLLVFWTTSCGICRHELPILDRVYSAAARNNVEIACVNIGDIDGAREILRPLRFHLNLVDPDGSVAHSYGVSGVPELVLVGADKKIKWSASGLQSEETLLAKLAPATRD